MQRELVIDIDISDYDEVRTCGSGGHICNRCWPFMAVAIQVRPGGAAGGAGCCIRGLWFKQLFCVDTKLTPS